MAGTALVFDILAKDRASKTFNDVGRAAQDAGEKASGIGSKLASVGGAVLKAGALVGTAVGGMAVAGGALGLKTAAGMEQARISFETMLGSAEKADVFLRDLSKFAASTPFEFPELQSAASSLISAGFEAGKVIPIMTTLGDVTSGMGTGSEGVKRATVALQQMAAAGRITGEDLNQLRDAGVPVFDLLSAATGKSKEQIAELAQAGKLGKGEMEALFKALETGKGLERFSGLMEKQSQSLSGLWSTFKDTLGMGLANAIAPAIPAIKNSLGQVSEALSNFFGGLQGKGKLSGLSGTFNTVGLAVRALFDAFKYGDVTSDGLVGKFERAGVALRALWLGLKALVAAFKDGDVTSDGFVGTMEKLGVAARGAFEFFRTTALPALREVAVTAASVLVPAIGKVIDIVGSVTRFFREHSTTAKVLATIIGTVLVAAWTAKGVAATVNAAKSVVAWLTTATAANTSSALQSKSIAQIIVGWTVMAAKATANAARVVAGWVLMGVQSLAQAARMAAAWVIAMGPVGWVIAAVVALVAIIIANWDTIVAATKAAWDRLVGYLNAAWEWIKGAASAAFGFLKNLFLNFTGPGLIIKHWETIKNATGAAWQWIKDTVRNGVRAVGDLLNGLLSFVTDLPNRILRGFGNIGSLLYNSGKDLLSGFIDGIKSMAGKLVSTIKDTITDRLPRFVKDALGIRSPSKVFMQLGAQTAQGFSLGIEGGQRQAQSAVAGLIGTASGGVDVGVTTSGGYAGRAASGGGVTVNIYGPTDPAGAARAVRDELLKLKRSGMAVGLA